jgi:hypothetical protein
MTITIPVPPGRVLAWIVAALASVAAVLAPYSHLAGRAARAQDQASISQDRAVEDIELTAGPVK